MKTEVISIDPARPESRLLDRAASVLRRGGLVAFPTETVYGLGANAMDAAAAARIFVAKGRPATNPVIVHVVDAEQATSITAAWPKPAQRLAKEFWPGPLTLVLPKRREVPDAVTAGGETVAIRAPGHPVALGLLKAVGLPVAAPSANLSARITPTRAEHVLRGLDGRIEMLLDGGPTSGGLESTVLDLTTTPPRVLRPGLVAPHEIEAVIGRIEIAASQTEVGPARSPGMLARHYAPSAPLECCPGSWSRVKELCASGLRVGWLSIGPAPEERLEGLFTIEMPAYAVTYASQLYAALHTLEAIGLDKIVVELPPDEEGWLAVRDRLRRAATRERQT